VKYIVKETKVKPSNGIKMYNVFHASQPERSLAQVWVDGGCKPRCTECSGPLVAMSASCVHARAVRRALLQENET
jgi:hypothetical protein